MADEMQFYMPHSNEPVSLAIGDYIVFGGGQLSFFRADTLLWVETDGTTQIDLEEHIETEGDEIHFVFNLFDGTSLYPRAVESRYHGEREWEVRKKGQ